MSDPDHLSHPDHPSDPAPPVQDYRTLPERVDPAQMREEQPASDPPDPVMGRDPERDWMLRAV